MSAKLKPVLFIIGLCVVCSLVLTFGATALKGPQERNAQLDRQTNLLRAAGLLPAGKIKVAEINAVFASRITGYFAGPNGSLSLAPDSDHQLLVYAVFDGQGQTVRQIIWPFNAKGVWGPILGYLALSPNLNTVTGFTVYQQNETAGLGAEIAQSRFQNQWRGKQLFDAGGQFRSVIIAKGPASPSDPLYANTVDGISGATNTGRALSQSLFKLLEEDLPLLQKVNWSGLKK